MCGLHNAGRTVLTLYIDMKMIIIDIIPVEPAKCVTLIQKADLGLWHIE